MSDAALLDVRELCAGYGQSQVLDNVSFSMGVESVSIIGRNGMGKSTLCNTIIGLLPTTSGTAVLDGTTLTGRHPENIAQAGIAYVPQGRRLFATLTVDEHIAMLAKHARGKRWTPDAVVELFPRLGQRRRSRAGDLSGGEQQMLAVARALLLNGSLLMMDEPSEGLAPAIVDSLIETVRRLVAEGVAVLVVEQNLHAATSMAERVLVMVAGRLAAETTATALLADPDLQRRYLGVDTIEDT
jgi:branched-chain amino acid transport system ATP-binding protein